MNIEIMFKQGFCTGLICFSVFIFLVTACKNSNKSENLLPADMVENPISADHTTDLSSLPALTFETVEHDFGKIKNGDVVSFGFKFKNTGKSDLLISKVSTSCGCTASDYPKDPVSPGKDGIITLTFKSEGKTGIQNKMATVVANTQPNTKVLKIKAIVLE